MANTFQEIWIAYTSILVLVVVGLYSLRKVQQDYQIQGKRSTLTAATMGTYYIVYDILLLYFALFSFWPLPFNAFASIMIGSVVLLVGLGLFLAGAVAFRSFQRVIGIKTNRLMSSGIYQRSRNPQMIGLGLAALGVALTGRSGLALLLVAIGWVLGYVQIRGEEKHMNRVFREEYQQYCARVPRFIRFPISTH